MQWEVHLDPCQLVSIVYLELVDWELRKIDI